MLKNGRTYFKNVAISSALVIIDWLFSVATTTVICRRDGLHSFGVVHPAQPYVVKVTKYSNILISSEAFITFSHVLGSSVEKFEFSFFKN